MNNQKLTIVITGASNDTGKNVALEFAKKGFNIALTSRHKDALEELARTCKAYGSDIFEHIVDMSKQNEVSEFAKLVQQKFGKIDVWINNVSIAANDSLEETASDEFKNVLDASILGYLYGAKVAMEYFRNQGSGKLINVNTALENSAQPFSIAYTTSRAAIREMTAQLQQETQNDEDIQILLVSPDAPAALTSDIPGLDSHSVVSQIVQWVTLPEEHIPVELEHSNGNEDAINHRVRNIFWIGVAVAGVLAGVAAIYYRNKEAPIMSFDQIKGKLLPFFNQFHHS